MDSRLNQNETELGVLVLSVALKVLSDGDSLLDQEVKILRQFGGKASLSAFCSQTNQNHQTEVQHIA